MKQDSSGAANDIRDDIRPHPGPVKGRGPHGALRPLPWGGRTIRRVLSQALCRAVVRLTANDTESVTAMGIEKWSGNVTARSLSPGERAGVRASVNIHSIEPELRS